jgi:hypothetical protein
VLDSVVTSACYQQCLAATVLAVGVGVGALNIPRNVPPQGYIPNEVKYLPVLEQELVKHWPKITNKAMFAALIQQETCASLRSKKCWSPHAELKTSREYGFGLGQLTITSKFDNFKAARELHQSLKLWSWDNRYDANYQIRAMLLMNKGNYARLKGVSVPKERMAFMFASYNGGFGGVLSDRAVCRSATNCNPNLWLGHVEHHSKKKKTATKGYGKSFFQINREYVRNVTTVRKPRYDYYFGVE